jgi:hypothetical protein
MEDWIDGKLSEKEETQVFSLVSILLEINLDDFNVLRRLCPLLFIILHLHCKASEVGIHLLRSFFFIRSLSTVVFLKQYPVFICRANFSFVVTITAYTSIDLLLIAR